MAEAAERTAVESELVAVGETAILLHPLALPLVVVSIGLWRGRQQNDSLADGYRSLACSAGSAPQRGADCSEMNRLTVGHSKGLAAVPRGSNKFSSSHNRECPAQHSTQGQLITQLLH